MTGFAVHEVGHTKLDFYAAIVKRWPGKKLPITLGNIIEDVVLEMRTVERFPGFADHGEGNVFRPTLEWVAKEPAPPLRWSGRVRPVTASTSSDRLSGTETSSRSPTTRRRRTHSTSLSSG